MSFILSEIDCPSVSVVENIKGKVSEMADTQTHNMFIETLEEALREAVTALGGAKKVGSIFKPEMLSADAGNWLNDCLNPKKRDKLSYAQIMWILREARSVGFHSAINFICHDSGYSNPQPVEPESEQAKLMREFIEATKQQSRNVARMEELARLNIRSAA